MNHFLFLSHGQSGVWMSCTCAPYSGELYGLGHVPSLMDVTAATERARAEGHA